LIVFGTNISDTTRHQMTVQFPISPSVCCCITWGKTTKCSIFIKDYYYFIKITHKKTHFVYIFIALASLSSCSFLRYLQKMLAHYTNTEM